jgi:hypothetical protein
LLNRWISIAVGALALSGLLAPATAGAAAPAAACSLLKLTEVRAVLGTGAQAELSRGGSSAECIVRGGGRLPLILLVNGSGKQGYKDLLGAAGPPVNALRGVGTQAATYDHMNRLGVSRGVIVRKGNFVLQLSTNGIGPTPPGLATVAQLVKLARLAVQRL